MATLPPPVQSESLPVPGDHSFGLNYHQCGLPTIPQTREPNPQESVSNTQTQPMAAVEPLEDYELLAEGKYLGVQRCAGSESLSNRREQRDDDREHGIGKLYPTPFKFYWFNENGVFGRDRADQGSCYGLAIRFRCDTHTRTFV